MRFTALHIFLLFVTLHYSNCQYQQGNFQGGGHFQQSSGSSGGSYQSGGGSQSRYQQAHIIVPGPGPAINSNNFGGQFKEQRLINIQENIQGVSQQGGGYGYGQSSSFQSSGGSGGYQYGGQQQGGRFGQGGYGGQMNGQRGDLSGRSVVVNTPMVLDSTSTVIKGSQVDLKLISYTNSGLRLANGTTCNCPNSNCNYVPSNQQNQCQFSFVIVISCADQSIQYIQSNFFPVPTNGVMTTGNWTNQYTFYMSTKPVAIDIFVQHLGVVIDSTSGQLLFFNHLSLVDSFVVDLSTFNTQNVNQGGQTLTLSGQIQQTQLQMALNLQCINNMMGPLCDLNCNNTNAQANHLVICYSNRTTSFSACKWNANRNQVTDCYICTHGVYNGTCAAAVNVNNWGVAYAFRTWTIVLGCLLGIALLLILCLIISYIICFRILNRGEKNESVTYRESIENTNYNQNNSSSSYKGKHDNGSNQPLISNEEWSSSSTTRKPVGILSKRNENLQTNSGGSEYGGRKQQDSPDTEESYVADGNVQQTTTTTTTTTRREHVV